MASFSRLPSLLFLLCAATFSATAATPAIIPLPLVMQVRSNVFTLCPNQSAQAVPSRATTKIVVDSASLETGQYLAMMLGRSTGYQFPVTTNTGAGPIRNAILITTVNALTNLNTEGYELTVAPDSVVIRAPAQGGAFYGVQTLLQLLPPQIMSPTAVTNVNWTAQCVYVQDQPRFKWRGVMLDVSRHFCDKVEVERILDGLALYKINTFHWHLTDDHGWRIEIKSYPNLTATASTNTAAWRSTIDYNQNPAASTAWNSSGKYGGYYTQDDIREVVAYATVRHINVVPELEFPAHCSAALVSYPELGCGNVDNTTRYDMDNIHYAYTLFSLANSWSFFTNSLTEVMNLFPSQYIHTGGDEVAATGDTQWTSYSPDSTLMSSLGITGGSSAKIVAYQHYLSTNLSNFIHNNGRTMCGWSEFEIGGNVPNAVVFDWNSSTNGGLAASNGLYVVRCPNGINYYQINNANSLLFDPYFVVGGNPAYKTLNNVYTYDPLNGINGSATNFVLGAQVNLWTEDVPSGLNMEYKIFPRICAEAELTWTSKPQANYTDFTNRLWSSSVQRIAAMGLNLNSESIPQIGTWGPSVPTSPTTVNYDITPYVTKSGEIDVSFNYTTGSDALNVFSVALLENGTQIDINTYTSFCGLTTWLQALNSFGPLAYYVVHLPSYHPGSTYTIQASISEHGANASSNGKVFLPNWN